MGAESWLREKRLKEVERRKEDLGVLMFEEAGDCVVTDKQIAAI